MVIDPKQIDELMDQSRRLFLKELNAKVERVSYLAQGDLSPEKVLEILQIVHTVRGTASTLGLEHLAGIGKEVEQQLRAYSTREKTDFKLKETLHLALANVRDLLQATESKPSDETIWAKNNKVPALQDLGKILLIDDDVTILKLLESTFTLEGYTVYVCDNPLSAMDLIAVSKPDVILLDIMMPKCNGYEILERVKAYPSYSDICVIFLSAADNIEDKVKGMKAGIDDYITKPFDIREVVSRVEMALQRANKFREKLFKDSMTGAYSRCYLFERLRDELERYKRNDVKFSIAFIDLDHFKQINDQYGHQTGDYVLQAFVAFAARILRESDCIFRYGGEEFVILLPDINEEQAYTAMERLRRNFANHRLTYAGHEFGVTFSCGVIEAAAEHSVSQLLSMCDEAMYAAKNAARNTVLRYSGVRERLAEKKKVLLVDDDNVILKLLRDRLSETGYHILTAVNGQTAIKTVAENYIDAVVLDVILPDIDGLEVCRTIKKTSLCRNTRIIMLSQKGEEQDIIGGLNSGADDYVTKPFSMTELEVRIMRILNR